MDIFKKGAICPECETGHLNEVQKDLVFDYKGHSKAFTNMIVLSCEVCGHERLPEKIQERIDKELTDFRRTIDGLLQSDELKAIRQKLGLNKKAMAERLSVDAKTVGRYESGKMTQSKQVDKLYRIFLSFPASATLLTSGSSKFLTSNVYPGTPGNLFTSSNSGLIQIGQAHFRERASSMYVVTVDGTYFRPKKGDTLAEGSEQLAA